MILRRKVETAVRILTSDGLVAFLKAIAQSIRYRLGPYSPDEAKIAFDVLGADIDRGLMVDVGAHFGSSLAPFANSGWHVFAFEPDSKNREKLSSAYGEFENVVIDSRAISNCVQESVTLYRSEESTGISGLSSFHSSHQPGEEVSVTTLEKFFDEQGGREQNVDFLKIDTEGFDMRVLEGLPLSKISPRMILCEFEDSKTVPLGYTFHDLAGFLVKHGYRLIISEWHPIKKYGVPHDWNRFVTYPCELDDVHSWGNILATKEDGLYSSLLKFCNKEIDN